MIWFQGDFYLDDLHCFDVEEPQQRERDFVQSKCNFAICSIICSIDRSSAKENHTAIQRPDDLIFFSILPCVSVFAFYCVNMRVGRTCKVVRPRRGKQCPQATLPPSDHSTQRSSTNSSGCGFLVVGTIVSTSKISSDALCSLWSSRSVFAIRFQGYLNDLHYFNVQAFLIWSQVQVVL